MCEIKIPEVARMLIKTMENNGFEAYVVGGCVRDSLLGIEPKDWDICTSATPEEIERCFASQKIVETGIKHGTVTVFGEGRIGKFTGFEITTFRTEGRYSDNRRPDKDVNNVRANNNSNDNI